MALSNFIHASCVSIDGKAVLLLGASGAGKSDVALRLIALGAVLVADDQVRIEAADGQPFAYAPDAIAGLIEARGVGIMRLPHVSGVPVGLAVRLLRDEAEERLPEPAFFDCFGAQVPLLSLGAFQSSTCAKIILHMRSSS